MPLSGAALTDALNRREIPKGLGAIPRQRKPSPADRRNSKMRSLTDDEVRGALNAGFRVYDKRRGIYVHI